MKEVIETLRRLTTASLSSEDRAVLEALATALQSHEALAVSELEAAIKPAAASAKSKSTTASKPKKVTTIDLALADRYTMAFADAAGDPARIKAVVSNVKSDKQVKIGELGAILSKIRGREITVSKRADGVKELEQWFQRRQDTARRLKDADGNY